VGIRIFNTTDYPADNKKINRLVKGVLKKEKKTVRELNIIIVDKNFIRRLNRKFLGRNRSTNVLAFDLGEVSEIYVSKDAVAEEEELYYYVLHGLLHIIGYEHKDKKGEQIMKKKCLNYLRGITG